LEIAFTLPAVYASGLLHTTANNSNLIFIFIPPSISPNIPNVGPKLLQLSQTKGDDCPTTAKRSFFRRKQKRKRAAHPTTHIGERDRMDGVGDSYQDCLGTIGLSDPFLALKEPDVECWAKFMKPEVVGALTDKEIKRQEHM